jgi:3',5'-cyclic AMP phosphodiesterase CpdA
MSSVSHNQAAPTAAGVLPAGVRLAHFSDIHVTTRPLGWRRGDWFSKRLTGWINLRWLGRRYRFRRSEEVLRALVADLRQRRPDRVIFSGDATSLGFDAEFGRAASILGLTGPDPLPGLAVPGNHDYYTRAVVASGLFERHFHAWQEGERIDGALYPFAQRVVGGPLGGELSLWLVAVNSCIPNRWAWDASGRVGPEQLDRLRRLLARLGPGLRVLVTHYPVVRASGKLEHRAHGLRDLNDLVTVAAEGGVCVWLHGHRHGAYHHLQTRHAPFPVICAGSATQSGRWSYGEYTITDRQFHAVRRVYDAREGRFRDAATFTFTLSGKGSSGG